MSQIEERRRLADSSTAAVAHARNNPLLALGSALGLVLAVLALSAPLLSPSPADVAAAVHLEETLEPPSWSHPFGTDQLGRDLLTRVLYGARVSLRIAVLVLLLACAVGVPLGIVAGYFGGRVDDVIMRVVDIFLAFPPLLLALALVAVLTPSIGSATIALAVAWWPWYARLARGQASSVAGRQLVESCRALGLSDARIVFRHVLPNAMVATLTFLPFITSGALVTLTSLDFLGFGLPPGSPSLGELLKQGKDNLQAPWLGIAGFIIISVMLTLLVFVGEAVRDAFDPRKAQR